MTVSIPPEHEEEWKAHLKALKVLSGLAYELKIPFALVGGFALTIFGYNDRRVKDLDILTTEDGLQSFRGLAFSKDPRTSGLCYNDAKPNTIYFKTKPNGVEVNISIDLVLLDDFKNVQLSTDEVLKRSLDVFDDKDYRITKCATLMDMLTLKRAAVARKSKDGQDAKDVEWIEAYVKRVLEGAAKKVEASKAKK